MNKPINLLVGGLTLFAAQGCKAPKQASQQAEHPNIIYVFPDQYRNQAMGFWRQDGFRDKVNFEGDPVHTPNLDAFARESMVLSSAQSNCPLSSPHRGNVTDRYVPEQKWCTIELQLYTSDQLLARGCGMYRRCVQQSRL